jgi:hypothetical protein
LLFPGDMIAIQTQKCCHILMHTPC